MLARWVQVPASSRGEPGLILACSPAEANRIILSFITMNVQEYIEIILIQVFL